VVRCESMASLLEVRLQLEKVVDLTVLHGEDRPIFIRHGLIAVNQIDDRKTARPDRRTVRYADPLVIGTAMHKTAEHPFDSAFRRAPIPTGYAGDPAHDLARPSSATVAG